MVKVVIIESLLLTVWSINIIIIIIIIIINIIINIINIIMVEQ